MRRVLVIGIIAILVLGAAGFGISRMIPKPVAGLKVDASPLASIFLNDRLVGKTPFEQSQPAGEYTIKLIPEENGNAATWQGRIVLRPGLQTYIQRDLGESEVRSGGEVLSFESIRGDQAHVEIGSIPDGANVLFDGQERGNTPLSLMDVLPGEHDVSVGSPGFDTRSVRIKAVSGYKLLVAFQLPLVQQESSPSASVTGVPSRLATPGASVPSGESKVTIKDTPTGFLRVRMAPNTSATESAQVKPGQTFPYTEEQDGWYKIEYQTGKEGWISGRYAQKVN